MNTRSFHRSSSCVIIMPFVIIGIISLFTLLSFFPNGIPKSYAHAFTIRSDPSPSQSLPTSPSKVDVYFSEPIDLRYSTIKVLDSGGKQVDNKDEHNIGGDPASLSVTLPSSGLKDGVYTVSSKVLSATDGHVVDNAFVFGIGQAVIPSAQSSKAQFGSQSQLYIPNAIARFPAYVGQVLVVGAAFATLWLWKPISEIIWLKDTIAPVRNRIDRSLIILMLIGSAILIVSDFGIIYVQANDLGTGINEAIGTKFGSVWVMRTIESFILFAVSLGIYLRRVRGRIKPAFIMSPSKGEVVSLLVIGLAILATTTLIGHGATSGQLLPIATDFIHNLAASLWIGGIIYLAFIVAPKLKQAEILEENVKATTLSIIIPRFSTIPVTILGVIVVTGPFLLYFIENNLDLTLASLYGKWLIIKLSLAAIMITIGGYNQRVIQRNALRISTITGIAAATIENPKGARHGGEQLEVEPVDKNDNNDKNKNQVLKKSKKTNIVSKFSRTTKVEAIVGIALLAAVALLVNTGTPGSEFQTQQQKQSVNALTSANSITNTAVSQQQHFTSTRFVEGGNKVVLSIDPFAPGNNNFKISFLDSKRNPLDIKSAQIRYTQIEKGIGPINVNTTQVSRGVFSVNAAFGLPGQWNLEVEGVQNKSNALNIVTSYDLFIKPKLDQLNFNIQEYKIPQNNSQPLYPLYNKDTNAIWVGDTAIDSGRIWEYNLTSSKYIEHKITGASIVTVMAFDPYHHLWFVDPIMKNLGQYDPSTGNSKLFKLPTQGVASGITVNSNDNNVWITAPVDNKVLRFNPQTNNFTSFTLPTENAQPFGIIADQISGQIWIAEGIGKIANIDPSNKFKISEYAPPTSQSNNNNSILKGPTALFADPMTGDIYISQHEGHTVSTFNPLLKTFKDFPPLDPNGLPFGMTMDSSYHNLWVAEHTINKIAVIDPSTGASKELTIPNQSPIVQWLTADVKGNIWLAEQRGNSLAVITSTPKFGQSSNSANPAAAEPTEIGNNNGKNNNNLLSLPPLGVSYAAVVGPSVAGGIIVSGIFYTKSIIDLKQSIRHAKEGRKNDKKY
ncbi:MAG: copper resistance protein CopC [Nitrososphaeraceae archaeon]